MIYLLYIGYIIFIHKSIDLMFKTQYHKLIPQRIDSFLQEFLKDYSRNYIQKMIESGFITKNGTLVEKSKTLVSLGDIIEIDTIQLKKHEFVDTLIHDKGVANGVEILYEHQDFLIVNKPAGLLVHKTMNPQSYSLVEYITERYPEIQGVQEIHTEGQNRSGIVHRIDKDTSGLLIVVRNIQAYYLFKQLFQARLIHKEYQCLVYGHLKDVQGEIRYPIMRSRLDHTKRVAIVNTKQVRSNTKEAHTEYEVIRRYEDYDLLKVFLHTGRTHQIRVHMQAIHHPIAGDRLYAGKMISQYPLPLERQFLHATKLTFVFEGREYEFQSQISDDLQKVLKELS